MATADPPALAVSVVDAYRQARRAFGRACDVIDHESLDALDDRAMTLWTCATLAEPFASSECKRLARQARDLSNLIGERRDLLLLMTSAVGRTAAPPSGTILPIEAFASRRMRTLELRILKRGRRLFSGKPARLAQRLADDELGDDPPS